MPTIIVVAQGLRLLDLEADLLLDFRVLVDAQQVRENILDQG